MFYHITISLLTIHWDIQNANIYLIETNKYVFQNFEFEVIKRQILLLTEESIETKSHSKDFFKKSQSVAMMKEEKISFRL